MRYSATVEIIKGRGEAIVSLFDSNGEWSGSGIVSVRSGLSSDLYEAGYLVASLNAQGKGGTLDRYRRVAA